MQCSNFLNNFLYTEILSSFCSWKLILQTNSEERFCLFSFWNELINLIDFPNFPDILPLAKFTIKIEFQATRLMV